MNAYLVHRTKEIFGDDVESFRPERWLEGDSKLMDHYMFQVSNARSSLFYPLCIQEPYFMNVVIILTKSSALAPSPVWGSTSAS